LFAGDTLRFPSERIQLWMSNEEIFLIFLYYIKIALDCNYFYYNWRVDGDSEDVHLLFQFLQIGVHSTEYLQKNKIIEQYFYFYYWTRYLCIFFYN